MKECIVTSLIFLAALSSSVAADEYQLVGQIPVGGEGGWDYLSIDAQARHLYVTHATKVVVIDLGNNSVIGEIADTPGVHGFALRHHVVSPATEKKTRFQLLI